jgi:hypothetical protein
MFQEISLRKGETMAAGRAVGYGVFFLQPYLSKKPEKHMNTQRILADETEALYLMPAGDFFDTAENSGTPEAAEWQSAGTSLMNGFLPDHGGSSLPFPFLAFGDEDEDEDIDDEEDNFDDMEDDFDDDFDDDDDDFDDDEDEDDFDDDEDDDYDYDDDVDYDDDFEE